jgi:hypothetical protein
MGEEYSTHGTNKLCTTSVGKPEWQRLLGKLGQKLENNIKIDVKYCDIMQTDSTSS